MQKSLSNLSSCGDLLRLWKRRSHPTELVGRLSLRIAPIEVNISSVNSKISPGGAFQAL